jgi:hypothetical protein
MECPGKASLYVVMLFGWMNTKIVALHMTFLDSCNLK